MTETFTLSVNYKGGELNLSAQLLLQGYTHKFKILIDGLEVFFEPDEEGSYRAIKMPWQDKKIMEKIDKHLLFEIQLELQNLKK